MFYMRLFCFVVAKCNLVHDVDSIHGLIETAFIASGNNNFPKSE